MENLGWIAGAFAACWTRKSSEVSSHHITHPRGVRINPPSCELVKCQSECSLDKILRAELSSNASRRIDREELFGNTSNWYSVDLRQSMAHVWYVGWMVAGVMLFGL